MRLYLIEPFHAPGERRIVAAANRAEACGKANVDPDRARIKDQTRFMLRHHHFEHKAGSGPLAERTKGGTP